MSKKFELTDESKVNEFGDTLYRIRATDDIPCQRVRKGDFGGWVRSAELVDGNAWVSGSAEVSGNARVFGNARVYGDAQVSGDARILDDARVFGNAQVSGNAQVYGNAWVSGNAEVSGNARVFGNAQVSGNAQVYGNAWVSGNARVFGNARVLETWHNMVVGPIGSEDVHATIYRTRNGGHRLHVGCWDGTLDTLMKEVKRRRDDWDADEATQELWVEQYRALKMLGMATVGRWKVEETKGSKETE